MTLGISKAYSPTDGDISSAGNYNTDVAALFNAFSGLEAQTSTLGGLTITPTGNSTTTFKITNAAATELFSIDTTNSYLKLKATGRFYLDGGSDTYFVESAANVFDLYVGGANYIKVSHAGTYVRMVGASLCLDTNSALTLNGVAGDNYMYSDGNTIYFRTAGANNLLTIADASITLASGATAMLLIDANTGSTGGSGSAGTGKQYVELTIKGTRYKLLHDGSI